MFNFAIWTPTKPLKGPFTKEEPAPFKLKTKYPKIKGFDYPVVEENYRGYNTNNFIQGWWKGYLVLQDWVSKNGYGQKELENAVNYLHVNGYFQIGERWNLQENDLGLAPFLTPVQDLPLEVWHIQLKKPRYNTPRRYMIRQRSSSVSQNIFSLHGEMRRRWTRQSWATRLPSHKAEMVKEVGYFNSMLQTLVDFGYVFNSNGQLRCLLPTYLETQFFNFIGEHLMGLDEKYQLGIVVEPTNVIVEDFVIPEEE